MNLVLRGHIRDTFEKPDLYELVKCLYQLFPGLVIYVHTWNVFANNLSWRHINADNTVVTEETVTNYFKDMSHLIKHIIVDDDQAIAHVGKTDGTISRTPMPLLGWKNYWFGQHRVLQHMKDAGVHQATTLVNMRFDILTLADTYDFHKENVVTEFISLHADQQFTRNVFVRDYAFTGMDNIYVGNLGTMAPLVEYFVYNMDRLIEAHPDLYHQEHLVKYVNDLLFP